MQIELQAGEQKINTWPVHYKSPGGRKFNGKLTITNKRLLYDVAFDFEAKGVLPDLMFIKWSTKGYLEIAKADIMNLEIKRHMFDRSAQITLADGSKHVFVYGMFRGSGVSAAIGKD